MCPEIWAVDSEWGYRDHRVDQESAWEPVVLCLVGLRSGSRHHFWRRDPGLPGFLRDHEGDVFVGHYALAEMKYLLRLGIPLPSRWFDSFVAWRYLTNRPNNLEAGLSAALHSLGLPRLAPEVKKDLQQRILHLEFSWSSAADRREIVDYCFSDCDGCGALHAQTAAKVPPELMTHWVEYLKAVARMELRGIPLDLSTTTTIRKNLSAIRAALVDDVNRVAPVFRGEQLHRDSFLPWCRGVGISWPSQISTATGKLYYSIDDETLKSMEGHHPLIAQIRQVQKTLTQFNKRRFVVDTHSGRHFFSTSVFRAVTGRNQPRDFIFSGPKWLRFLIVPESSDHVLVYVDFVAQEIAIAAALSGDPMMRAVYEASDCHMEFAIRANAAPPGATKQTHGDVRKRYKTVNLGVLYGQTSFGIANRLAITIQEAEQLLADHRELFPVFWDWSERMVQSAFDRGWIATPCGWRSKVPFKSNERTWMNWPMQSAGGDIMRLTITYLDRQNVRILAPVHDGFLLSCRRDQLDDLRAAVDYACHAAVEHVLPSFPMRWEVTAYEGRFEDDDGAPMWARLQSILEETHGEVITP